MKGTYENRARRLRERLDVFSVDALLILTLENVRYLSGFTGSAGALLVNRTGGYFITDSRYTTQAASEVAGFEIKCYRDKVGGLIEIIKEEGLKRIGFEPEGMTYGCYWSLSSARPEVELVPVKKELENLRLVKEEEEVESIRRAIEIADTAYQEVVKKIAPGQREREVALELEHAMRKAGGDALSFDVIVASGPRAALPHGKASHKTIEEGELVIIDFGISYQGYFSDETHTVAVSRADEKQKEVFQVVKEAHDLALAAVKPGVKYEEIDRAARDYIKRAGYGDYFGHGTGHGIGLAIHEPPGIRPGVEGVAEEGMVFTIEPGIYIPGWGGVRLEDVVLVTEKDGQVLSTLPKELKII